MNPNSLADLDLDMVETVNTSVSVLGGQPALRPALYLS
jgi:hypothetical protein